MSTYDYIIVGAGSAGGVLAARLSEDPVNRVLLLEAGPADDVAEVRIPALMPTLFHGQRDWDFRTEPQKDAAGREVTWPLGRTLGGSSSTNAMIYIQGSPADFDSWRDEYGCHGWGYADLLPYFERSRQTLRVEPLRRRDRLTRAWVDSARNAGLAAGFHEVNQRRGRRWSVADAYLHPAVGRPNLTVLTGALATKIVVQRDRAVGIRYQAKGKEVFDRASVEVILAAGAVKSPHLLLLSGIGPADELHAIPSIVDLPAVGSGLQDHPRCTALWQMAGPPRRNFLARWRWQLLGTGPFASNGGEAGGFTRTRPSLAAPDLQYMVCPPSVLDASEPPMVAVLITAVAVLSRGRIWLRSADPLAKPAIDPAYLSAASDLDVLMAGVRQSREIAAQEPFAGIAVKEVAPGAQVTSEAELRDWVRHNVVTMHHPTSTCAMGGSPDTVCDPWLRVRGIDGLRVVDASVMPAIPRGNTNAPTIALAERAADLILGNTPLAAKEIR